MSSENRFEDIIAGKLCPYCNCNTKLVSGEIIYSHRINDNPRPKFLDNYFYQCEMDSDHYVGTYSNNVKSLGRLANRELRHLKSNGHKVFDPLWKRGKYFKSQQLAYKWLSEKMDLELKHTHFGMFTEEQCLRAIDICIDFNQKKILNRSGNNLETVIDKDISKRKNIPTSALSYYNVILIALVLIIIAVIASYIFY